MLIQFTHEGLNDLKGFLVEDQLFIRTNLESLVQRKYINHSKIKKLKLLPYLRNRCGDFRIFLTQDGRVLLI